MNEVQSFIPTGLLSYGSIIGVVVLALLILFWVLSLRTVVPTNMVHIVQRHSATTEYGQGRAGGNVYYKWPKHIPVLGLSVSEFTESIFQIPLMDYEAYDAARLPFVVDIAAFFRIKDAAKVAQRASSFATLEAQLKTILQGAIRSILAKNTLDDIMAKRSIFADQFTEEVQGQLVEWGVVTTKPIELMDLRDAKGDKVIANIMAKEQSRIEKESRIVVALNKQEAEQKEIDAGRQVELQRQEAQQQVGVRSAKKEQEVGIAAEQARQEIAAQSKVTTERDMDVKRVQDTRQAEINRDVAKVQAEQQKSVMEIKAEAEKTVLITKAEGDKLASITTAEGKKESSVLEAFGIQSIGEAKAAAERAMLQAPVDTQISLAKEIGGNQEYQEYLITIRKIEAQQAIGIEAAQALKGADLKVIANSGDVSSGVNKLLDVVSPAGGTSIAGMLAGLAQTEQGQGFIDKFLAPKK
jgi:flotillin